MQPLGMISFTFLLTFTKTEKDENHEGLKSRIISVFNNILTLTKYLRQQIDVATCPEVIHVLIVAEVGEVGRLDPGRLDVVCGQEGAELLAPLVQSAQVAPAA